MVNFICPFKNYVVTLTPVR